MGINRPSKTQKEHNRLNLTENMKMKVSLAFLLISLALTSTLPLAGEDMTERLLTEDVKKLREETKTEDILTEDEDKDDVEDFSFIEEEGKTFRIIGDIIRTLLQPKVRGGCRTVWKTGYRTEYQEICSTSSKMECSSLLEEQCSQDYETEYETQCTQSTEMKCSTELQTKVEEKCTVTYRQECSVQEEEEEEEEIYQNIFDLREENESEQCKNVAEKRCEKVPVSLPVTTCHEVPLQRCEELPVRKPVKNCQKVPNKQCEAVPVKSCEKVPVRKQTKIAKKVCS